MTQMTLQQRSEVSSLLITNDGGDSSNVETWGVSLGQKDATLMRPVFSCGNPCKVNKYDEDGNLKTVAAMNILQMRDHYRNYHLELGHTCWMPWVNDLFERAKAIEGEKNQMRKAKEEQEENDLAKLKKEFGFA